MDDRNLTCVNEDTFGPGVVGCRQHFDFTQTFEQSILSIAPSSGFLILATLRLGQLYKRPVILKGRSFQVVKLTAATFYLALQASLLVLATRHDGNQGTEIPAASLSLCASVFVLVVSFFEHTRSLRASTLLNTYLLVSLLFDAAQTRTKWLSYSQSSSTKVFTASVGLKIALLAFESRDKSRWISSGESYSPEATSGIFNRGFLYWLNDLVVRGYRKTLSNSDLYMLDSKLSAERHHDLFWHQWQKNCERCKAGSLKHPLIATIVTTLRGSFLTPVVPRLLLGGSSFSQPFFINVVLEYLQEDPGAVPQSHGYGLIGASGLIYTGLAVSSGLYWQTHQRALAKLRSCLVTAIYRKTAHQKTWSVAGSSAITLMNTDILRIQSGLLELHEFWACIIETAVSAWLLERQLGTVFLAPIVVVLVCTALTFVVAKFTGRRQAEWMSGQQQRIGLTSSLIPNLLAIKISGLEYQTGRLVQGTREAELKGARRFRILTSTTAALAYAPLLLSPAFAFAVGVRELTISRVFTSLAWIHMLCNGLPRILQSVPQMVAALASLSRIEGFLASLEHVDFRKTFPASGDDESRTMVTVRDGRFGWKPDEWVIQGANLSIHHSEIVMIVGAVAAGKSTLTRALLGEIPFHEGEAIIHSDAKQAAYCDQDPFLINGTIRENVVSFGDFNGPWYEHVLNACHLGDDFAALPKGDQSIVGSGGLALSGGQKKRVALARALYSRPKFVVLDDVLSGLDSRTEERVARDVFGSNGLLRQMATTVVFCTQSAQHLRMADQVLVLRDGEISSLHSEDSFDLVNSAPFQHPQEAELETVGNRVEQTPFTAKPADASLEQQQQQQPTNPRTFGGIDEHRFYLRSIGFSGLIPFALFSVTFAFLFNFGNIWLQFWARSNEQNENRTQFYLGLYFCIEVLCSSLMGIFAWYGGCVMAPKASSILHLNALRTLLKAPLWYLTKVDASVPTGYFAQDMGVVDFNLAISLDNTVLTGLTTLGQAVVIGIASPWLLVGYPILGAVLFVIQKVYLRTSTQLRFLILEAKDPLYKHFMETIAGLPTIRAFNWITPSTHIANTLIDESQRPSYLLCMLTQWLNTVLNMSVTAIAVLFVALATQLRTNAGFTGVGLVSLMSFAEMVGNLIRCYAQLQTATAALSRLKGFEEVGSEEDRDGEITVEEWPARGEIRILGVDATYDVHVEENKKFVSVLSNVSLEIMAGEKVLVCGRTGSGKSSLLLLLQGFLTPTSGSILVDGIPLNSIARPTLRNRIIAIPQTPFFLPDGHTTRENLEFHGRDTGFDADSRERVIEKDSSLERQDAECESALRAVGLWDVVLSRGGLDAGMSEGSLSKGEKQLFSLARAVVRARLLAAGGLSAGVLLLDEVNTGLDGAMEKKMWEVVEMEFGGYTVVCVAHGLGGANGCNKVVVLDRGEVVEVGHPMELLERGDGRFKELWERDDTRVSSIVEGRSGS